MTIEWLPGVQCPQEDAPVNQDTDYALRQYIRKLEIELLAAPDGRMISSRDELIDSNSQLLSDRDGEIRRLKAEVEDLSKIIQNAALTDVMKGLVAPDAAQMFMIDKAEWKNRIITTLGFAEREIYMQFSMDRKLIRVVTDADVTLAQQPPV